MTPDRAERYLRLCKLALELMEREDIPQDVRLRAEQVLNLHEKATHFEPRIVREETVLEPE